MACVLQEAVDKLIRLQSKEVYRSCGQLSEGVKEINNFRFIKSPLLAWNSHHQKCGERGRESLEYMYMQHCIVFCGEMCKKHFFAPQAIDTHSISKSTSERRQCQPVLAHKRAYMTTLTLTLSCLSPSSMHTLTTARTRMLSTSSDGRHNTYCCC